MHRPPCYQEKVSAHIAQTVTARPELVQISTAYGGQKEGSPVLPRNKYTAIRDDKPKSKDECEAARVQSVQVHHRRHHHRKKRCRHHSEGMLQPRMPGSPLEAVNQPR